MSAIIYVSGYGIEPAKVERNGDIAMIRFGSSAVISLDMTDLRDLWNDMAEVLDGWFDEVDRAGKSRLSTDGRDTNVSLPERDRLGTTHE